MRCPFSLPHRVCGFHLGFTLEDAVRVAAPGTTLILRAGTHRLSRPLTIHQALTLVGDGRESTRVVCSSPGYVMRVEGDGRFAARDVTFLI